MHIVIHKPDEAAIPKGVTLRAWRDNLAATDPETLRDLIYREVVSIYPSSYDANKVKEY